MDLTDTRIYRVINISGGEIGKENRETSASIYIKPYASRYTYVGDYFESPESVARSIADYYNGLDREDPTYKEKIDKLDKYADERIAEIKGKTDTLANNYTATMSMIHPYALIRLTGTNYIDDDTGAEYGADKNSDNQWSSERFNTRRSSNIIDKARKLRWYEVDARMTDITSNFSIEYDNTPIPHYAKAPTTKDLINWSAYDKFGRFPYAFQDFVFCKYWNKIENNRLITLRRYPAPVLDNVIPANYKGATKANTDTSKTESLSIYKSAFSPLATAVTYFGEGTENSLKDLLKFTVGYNWSELNADVYNTSSTQIEEGGIFNDSAVPYLNSGLGFFAIAMGIMGDYTKEKTITPDQIRGLPPDPYENGPYENRVIGPVNVINNVYKRERGLKFEQDSIVLTFDYVARPIAYVNNKAILLDLLANILAMTYSRGIWFGGAHRYRNEHPAVYPWRDMSSLNKVYQGKLFGKDGAFMSMYHSFFNEHTEKFAMNFAGDLIEGIKQVAKDLVNSIKNLAGKKDNSNPSDEDIAAGKKKTMVFSKIQDTAGKVIAAHMLKGQQLPWLEGAKALLTGEPVGDWHITIGNPLNPIAMIGNLIVDNCEIEFYDELGPDDFPIGFKAKVTLKHGMGRDKDAVESMFNRGNGRIYMLSDAFKSSADTETTVDAYTGYKNKLEGKAKIGNWGELKTTGSFSIDAANLSKMSISADMNAKVVDYNPEMINLIKLNENEDIYTANIFRTTPWAMNYIL